MDSEFDNVEEWLEPSDEGELSRDGGWVNFEGGVDSVAVTGESAAISSMDE